MGNKYEKGTATGIKNSQIFIENLSLKNYSSSYMRNSSSNYVIVKLDNIKKEHKLIQDNREYFKKHPFAKPTNSPISIPNSANVKIEHKKNGYEQAKYTWTRGDYSYEARWHTKTPGAPVNGQSWVVIRTIKGIGAGKNARPNITNYLSGNKWISENEWGKAINARKNGTATKAQIEILDKGHFRRKKKR